MSLHCTSLAHMLARSLSLALFEFPVCWHRSMVSCHVSCCEGRTLQCSILSDGVWDIFHMGQVTATTHYSAAVCGKNSLLRML